MWNDSFAQICFFFFFFLQKWKLILYVIVYSLIQLFHVVYSFTTIFTRNNTISTYQSVPQTIKLKRFVLYDVITIDVWNIYSYILEAARGPGHVTNRSWTSLVTSKRLIRVPLGESEDSLLNVVFSCAWE